MNVMRDIIGLLMIILVCLVQMVAKNALRVINVVLAKKDITKALIYAFHAHRVAKVAGVHHIAILVSMDIF